MSDILILSELAIEKLKDSVKETGAYGIRVGVQGGGCSGFTYVLRLLQKEEIKEDWIEEDHGGILVFVDPMSAMYLEETTLDYIVSEFSSGFKFSNPRVSHQCGCGASFSF